MCSNNQELCVFRCVASDWSYTLFILGGRTMEEKEIITGKKKDINILLFIPIILIILSILLYALNFDGCRDYSTPYTFEDDFGYLQQKDIHHAGANFFSNLVFHFSNFEYSFAWVIPVFFWSGVVFGITGLIFLFANNKDSITATDKRVYGTAIWGKRVDLPLDMISAVSTGFPNKISVATSSGYIKFIMIDNNNEVQEEISKLLIKRQEKGATATTAIKQENPQSNADELQKYKNLLDNGTITQEEFEAKKKQLLGL